MKEKTQGRGRAILNSHIFLFPLLFFILLPASVRENIKMETGEMPAMGIQGFSNPADITNTAAEAAQGAPEAGGGESGRGGNEADNEAVVSRGGGDRPEKEEGPAVDGLKCVKDSRQVVLITSKAFEATSARVYTFENQHGQWNSVFEPFDAVIGKNGFTHDKAEGDKKSPIGAYELRRCFGRGENPGTKLEFQQFGPNTFWVDDSKSALYNTFQYGPADGRWSSAENLYKMGGVYKYFAVIEYNTYKPVPGKGSAIFLHVWKDGDTGTSGCTAVSESNLLKLLKWLEPDKKPLLIQGPESELQEM